MTLFLKLFLLVNILALKQCSGKPSWKSDVNDIEAIPLYGDDPQSNHKIVKKVSSPAQDRPKNEEFEENYNGFMEDFLDDAVPAYPEVRLNARNTGAAQDPERPILSKDSEAFLEGIPSEDDELLDTAETMVFRPYFPNKNRKNKNVIKPSNIENKVDPVSSAGASKNPPPVLIYDSHTGSYYPVRGYRPYYSTFGETYPIHYRGTK